MIKKLFQRKGEIVSKMRALLDTATKANRDLTADESTSYTAMENELATVEISIKREQSVVAAEASVAGFRDGEYRPGASITGADKPRGFRATAEYKEAFFAGFIRRGANNLGPQFMNVLSQGVDADGGFLVPTETEMAIVKSLLEQSPIRAYADVKTTALDSAIPVRTGIPTFGWIAEGGNYGKGGSTYGKLTMQAHKYGGIVPISDELLQDAIENMELEINETAALAFGELESTGFMIGDGVGKPLGLFAQDSVAGVTIPSVETASATAITADELIDLFHAVTDPYRRSASWVLRDATVKAIRKLKNGTTGDYMWQPGLVAGQPDMILGRPVVICKDAPAIAASAKSIAFGNLKAFRIRDRVGVSVKPLNELYAEAGQVGFRFTRRTDAKLCDAKAIAFLKQKA